MRILLDREGRSENLPGLLADLDADPEVGGILLLACDENGFTPDNVDACLQATATPVFGGVFPQILHGQERLTRATVAVGLPCRARVGVIESVSRPDEDFEERLAAAFDAAPPPRPGTMFVFVDGFAERIGALIDGLYDLFGLEINYLGGGAGSLSFVAKPCVISNRGLARDAAVLALTDLPSGIGVAHGWLPISDAFKVTEAEGNVIHTLDWRPAYQVYREVVAAHSGRDFDAESFFAIAKAYPFGIARLGAEMVVRDPLQARGDALVCVGEVRQGAYVHILHGDQASLLAAASQARALAEVALGGHAAHARVFVDCISRVLFLEDDFHRELAEVGNADLPMIGALSIGEIANNGDDYLEFYNKTAVVGLI